MGEEDTRRRLSQLLSPDVTARVLAESSAPTIQFEVREVVGLHARPRGYEAECEAQDPSDVARAQAKLLPELIRVVHRHGGLCERLLGGGLMALFGVPGAEPGAAARAASCALELSTSVPGISVGAHVGPAAVGFFGAPEMLSYVALGDVVNVAIGLAHACEALEVRAAISDVLHQSSGGRADFVALGPVEIPGRHGKIAAFGLR